jgi:Protein of unknown function (DUF3141)
MSKSALLRPQDLMQISSDAEMKKMDETLEFEKKKKQKRDELRHHLQLMVPLLGCYPHCRVDPIDRFRMDLAIHEGLATMIGPNSSGRMAIDPRAGHGPGIGGFKADSEIGVALKAGHP